MTFSRMFKLKVLPRVNIWRATGWRIKILEITFLYVHGLTLKREPVLATPRPFLPCCICLELEPLCWRKTNQHRASRRRYELNVDRKGCKSLNSTLIIYLKLQWKIIQHILYLNTREINRGTRMDRKSTDYNFSTFKNKDKRIKRVSNHFSLRMPPCRIVKR